MNYHIITADGTANRKNSFIPLKALRENGIRVALQESEHLIYNPSIKTFNQYDMLIEKAAPTLPIPDLNTMNQQTGM